MVGRLAFRLSTMQTLQRLSALLPFMPPPAALAISRNRVEASVIPRETRRLTTFYPLAWFRQPNPACALRFR